VAIRLDWLQGLHTSFDNPEGVFFNALDELVIHEVYGHLVPIVTARDLRAGCADPHDYELADDSCVGRREQTIRDEISAGVGTPIARAAD
jgi:hypothetical protein